MNTNLIRRAASAAAIVTLTMVAACTPWDPAASAAPIAPADDCRSLAATYQERSQAVMPYGAPEEGARTPVERDAGAATADAAGDAAAPAAPAASGTNVQETGVDEADTVETDGARLFRVTGGSLRIVDVRTSEPKAIATLDLGDGDHELLLGDDRLTVVTQSWPEDGTHGPQVKLRLYDVADAAAAPTLLRTLDVDGSLLGARASEGTVHLALQSGAQMYGFADDPTAGRGPEPAQTSEASLPTVRVDGGAPSPLLDCGDVWIPRENAGAGFVTVFSTKVEDAFATRDATAVLTAGDTMYMAPEAVYVATQRWDGDGAGGGASTAVHRFDLGTEGTEYDASGKVRGSVLGRWAFSERDGVLRVATTRADQGDRTVDGFTTVSGITTLRPDGDQLVEVGSVSGLGPGETIRGIRYIDDQAYVVTFRQTDPLYVVDLADPAAPAVRGELKIPGYSAYLHPVGDGRLAGVGQDADPSTGRPLGLQVGLFDVSDPASPTRTDIWTAPAGTQSAVESDSRAFLWWAPTGAMAVPYERWGGWDAPRPGSSTPPIEPGIAIEDVDPVEVEQSAERGVMVFRPDGRTLGTPVDVRLPDEAPSATGVRAVVAGERLLVTSASGVLSTNLDGTDPQWLPY